MESVRRKFVFALIYLSIIGLSTACDKQGATGINIFNQKVETKSVPKVSGHDERFLEVTGLRKLSYVVVDSLSMEVMDQISTILLPAQKEAASDNKTLFAYIYTTKSSGVEVDISKLNTHAFSIVGAGRDGIKHFYYERQSDNTFREVLSLSRKLDGLLNMDEIRMLHFAAIKGSSLPKESGIFEFSSELFKTLAFSKSPNRELMKVLLMDQTRSKGSKTVGLYGDALYSALRADDNPGTGSCGNVALCPPGGNGSCVSDPVAGHMCQIGDGGGGGGGCTAAQLPALSQTLGFDLAIPIDFRSIHSFRDEFLTNSKAGKEYVSYMYVFSQFARMDIKSLSKYAAIIGPLQASISTIMSDTDNGVVVTADLEGLAKEIINAHKGVEDRDFQNILLRMEFDLSRLAGLKRDAFIREFQSYQPAGG